MGRLKYKLMAPQVEPYELFYKPKESRRDVWIAGRRCRKSTLLLTLHAETCIREPGVETAYVAPVEKGLEAYMRPIIRQVFEDCPDDFQPQFKDNALLFKNGSVINFNGCNMRQYRYMRGRKLRLATADEPAEIDDLRSAVDDVLYPAVWDSDGRMVLAGTPPPVPSPDHPLMVYVASAKASGSYWHASVYDAGYSREKIAEALRETSQGAIQIEESKKIVDLCDPGRRLSIQEIYDSAADLGIGREALTVFLREFCAYFIRDENFVIVPEFDEAAHVMSVGDPPYLPYLHKGSGSDLGVEHKTVELFGYYDFPRSKIVVKKEFYLQGADVRTDSFADLHRQTAINLGWEKWDLREGKWVQVWRDPHVAYYSDNSNLMLLNDLAVIHKIAINPTDKQKKIEWLNLVKILFKQGRFEIDPSCKLLIATLNGAFWKDAKKLDFGETTALGHMDALAALIYFVRNLDMSTNPFPANYDVQAGMNFDPATHVYPAGWKNQARTEEGRALQKAFSRRIGVRAPIPKRTGGL